MMDFDPAKYRLRSMSFFGLMSDKDAAYVKSRAVRKEYRKGQLIQREGNYSNGVFIVRKGRVKIHNANAAGKESIIYVYGSSDFFGYRPLIAKEPNPVSATAMDAVSTIFVPRAVVEQMLERSHDFVRNLMVCLSSEFTVWINKITLYSQFAVRERVGLALLILGSFDPASARAGAPIVFSISRDDLAAYVGTAKETVVRMLRVFKDAAFIRCNGSKVVVRRPMQLLESLA